MTAPCALQTTCDIEATSVSSSALNPEKKSIRLILCSLCASNLVGDVARWYIRFFPIQGVGLVVAVAMRGFTATLGWAREHLKTGAIPDSWRVVSSTLGRYE